MTRSASPVRIILSSPPRGPARISTAARVRQSASAFLPSLTGAIPYLPQTANFAATPAFNRSMNEGSLAVGVTCNPGNAGCLNPQPCVVTVDPATGQTRPGCQRVLSTLPNSGTLYNYWSLGVGLQWTLFDFGRTYFGWRSAQENRSSSDEALQATILEVSLKPR